MKTLIGIERIDYVSKKTDKKVSGYKVYFEEEIPEEIGTGFSCDCVFLNDDHMNTDLTVGDNIDVRYNKYGMCVGVDII